MRGLFALTAAVMALPVLLAAQVSLGGSRSGFVFDEIRGEIRPVIGEPGAAYLGPPLRLEIAPSEVLFRDGGSVAVAIAEVEGERFAWRVKGLTSGAPQLLRLGPANKVWISSNGAMAVLEAGDGLRMVLDLDREPAVGAVVPFSSLPGRPTAIAFRSDPACAIVAAQEEETTALALLCADAPAEPRAARWLDAIDIGAMFYSAPHGGLWIADRAGARVLRVAAPIEAGEVETMAEGVFGALGMQPVSNHEIAVAQQDAWMAIVDARDRGVTAYLELPAEPDGLEYMAPGRILVCTRLRRDPVLVIDLSQDRASFFIPLPGGFR